jgi:glutathione peroxidase
MAMAQPAGASGTNPAIYDIQLKTLDGKPTTLAGHRGRLVLIVNTASQCGLTPQLGGLQQLQDRFADRGLDVLGFPCNQFGGQEPGTPDEIAEVAQAGYGATFPLFEKIDVNGENRHPLFALLTQTPYASGTGGDVLWNFEKFLVSSEGEVIFRWPPLDDPLCTKVIAAIEANLPLPG